MKLAYKNRPDGPFIKKKYFEYRNKIQKLPNKESTLKELVQSGDLVIIPIGFWCHTRGMIKEVLDIKQASLPFDNVFFHQVV